MRLVIPGRPVPASRPRVTKGHAYYPKRYADWLEAAAWQARSRCKPVDGAVAVSVVVRRDSIEVEIVPSKVQRPSGLRGDLDNYGAKAVLDALQKGGVLVNDSQVTELTVRFG
jgi:Holliday junction resolvase RusA-like endonuclease